MKPIAPSLRPHPNLARWSGYAVLALFALISLGPIWIAVKTALSDSRTLFSSASSFLPQDPTLFNILRVLGFANPADPRLAQMSYGKIEFFWPFLVGRSESVRVMAVAINAFRQQQAGGTPDWSGLMACTVLGLVPIAVLLVLFGRKVVESFQYAGPR